MISNKSRNSSYDLDNGVRILLGVTNAFDENPPQLTFGQSSNEYAMVGNSLLASNYDMLGRRVFANLTWNFE